MNSEKVKEIKKGLEYCKQNEIEDTCKYCLDCPASDWDYEKECTIDLFQKTLTLINELESENERLNKSDTSKEESSIEYYNLYKDFKRENQELKDRIADMESENKRLNKAINNVQKGFDNGEFISKDCQTKTLKQFAERLKEHPTMKIYSLHNACERIPKAIDETLKEYEK